MICLQTVEKYCQEHWKIENYEEAINDTEQTWDCHHRHEIDWDLPREELIAIGRYYDVHYSELIFLTPGEHIRLHCKGTHHTEEAKQKISECVKQRGGHSGENNPNYKYHITAGELYDLYIVQDLSTQKIAKLYGCSWTCICNKLKKYNIKK